MGWRVWGKEQGLRCSPLPVSSFHICLQEERVLGSPALPHGLRLATAVRPYSACSKVSLGVRASKHVWLSEGPHSHNSSDSLD